MSANYDVVIIGGGHNALIVAAYLSKAGLGVCVVEEQDKVGGSTITKELAAPGFKDDWGGAFHETLRGNPLIVNDELGLQSKYGLKYLSPTGPITGMVFPDDRALFIYPSIEKTCDSIAQFSQHDAEVYPKYCESSAHILAAARIAYFSPPPSFGSLVSFLEASEAGRESLRVMLSSPVDIAEEWFESEQVKLLLYHLTHPSGHPPYAKGTGLYALTLALLHAVSHSLSEDEQTLGGFGTIPEGGSGALAEALAACIKDEGGTIITSREVKTVKVEAGEAKGVILENGDEITATKAVVSGVNVKQLFLDMLKADNLPSGLQDKVRHLKHSEFTPLRVYLAINNIPVYKAGGDTSNSFHLTISPFMDEFMDEFEAYRRGIPCYKLPQVFCFSLIDPTRAPAGKYTLLLGQNEPYNLEDGSPDKWDEIKQDVANRVLETLRNRTTNMGDDNIIGMHVVSPLDNKRGNSAMVGGDWNHIHMGLSQMYNYRPLPEMSHYSTPIKKLYLCGASTHPGGGITGHGRITAQVMMEDFGIDFNKVIAKRG